MRQHVAPTAGHKIAVSVQQKGPKRRDQERSKLYQPSATLARPSAGAQNNPVRPKRVLSFQQQNRGAGADNNALAQSGRLSGWLHRGKQPDWDPGLLAAKIGDSLLTRVRCEPENRGHFSVALSGGGQELPQDAMRPSWVGF
jgi:hypothetical protein